MGRYNDLLAPSKPPIKQEEKPANPQAGKPEKPLTPLPASPQDSKPANKQSIVVSEEKPEKYTTRLKPTLIKQIKHYALEHDCKDYEVVEWAVTEYIKKQ